MKLIGIEKDGAVFQAVSLSFKRGQFTVESMKTGQGEPFLKKLIEKKEPFITGVRAEHILIRHMQAPLKSQKALHKILPFQFEALLPYSFDEVCVYPFYTYNKGKSEGLFFTVTKQNLQAHLKNFSSIDPEMTSCDPMALFRFSHFNFPKESTYIIFHIGRTHTQLVSILKNTIQINLTFPMGSDHFIQAFLKDGQEEDYPSLEELDSKRFPVVQDVKERFLKEIERCFCFFEHKKEKEALKKVLFVGEGARILQPEKWIEEAISFSFSILYSKKETFKEMQAYAIPMGLALDGLKKDKKSVQFRQGEFAAKKTTDRIRKKIIKSLYLCAGLALGTFLCLHTYLLAEKNKLSKSIDQYVEMYQERVPSVTGVKNFHKIDEKLHFLGQQLKLPKDNYLYFAPPPKVADLFRFLSSFPEFKEGKLGVQDLDYQVVDYPSLSAPFEPYKIKVHMKVNLSQRKEARSFYDALLNEKRFIDQTRDVVWNGEEDGCEITFFLKV